MWIELPEAVKMYARFGEARYGEAASPMVREKAWDLERQGDLHGHQVWTDVAHEIEHPRVARRSPKRAQ
jgi:hypothetical protein